MTRCPMYLEVNGVPFEGLVLAFGDCISFRVL